MAVELDDREREARIDLAVPLELSELEEVFRRADRRPMSRWSGMSAPAAVLAQRTRRYGALIIETRPLQAVPPELAVDAMLSGVRQLGIAALPVG